MLGFRTMRSVSAILYCLSFTVASAAQSSALPPEVESDFGLFYNPTSHLIGVSFQDRLAELDASQKPEAITRLRKGLVSSHCEVRRRASLALHRFGDDAGVPVMIADMASVTNRNDRNNVVVALRVMKDRRAIPTLIETAEDPSPYIRSISLAALGEMMATNSYDVLVDHLDDFERHGGCIAMYPADLACYALGALGDKKAIPLLMNALDHRETQNQACQALEKLTGQSFRYDVKKWKKWWKNREPNK
jgi:HEAT repeat protein